MAAVLVIIRSFWCRYSFLPTVCSNVEAIRRCCLRAINSLFPAYVNISLISISLTPYAAALNCLLQWRNHHMRGEQKRRELGVEKCKERIREQSGLKNEQLSSLVSPISSSTYVALSVC